MLKLIIFTIFFCFLPTCFAEDKMQYNIFIDAVRSSDHKKIKLMLKNGFDINCTDKNGWTALHWANFSHHLNQQEFIETLGLLIKNGANVNVIDHRGRNPLIILLQPGTDQISPPPVMAIDLFIKNGIDINTKDESGNSVYRLGRNSEYPDVKKYFFKTKIDSKE